VYDEKECECKAYGHVEGCGVCSDLGKMNVINIFNRYNYIREDVTILFLKIYNYALVLKNIFELTSSTTTLHLNKSANPHYISFY
jgi:hypothetical protein